jgi:formylglycine-generating enzyme required for sulfatase activity
MADKTSDDKVVYNSAKNVTMFVYEATRYDATATVQGVISNHRPCSVAGKAPWSNITADEAAAACAMIGTGWRLCKSDEWQDVCNGPSNTTFPYGATYNPTACVGYDYTSPAPAGPVATGAATACVSDASPPAGGKAYDMSGNVKEWTSNAALTPPYEIRGGAYDIASFTVNGVKGAPGLQCDASTPAPSVPVRLPSVGFRCCLTGQMP